MNDEVRIGEIDNAVPYEVMARKENPYKKVFERFIRGEINIEQLKGITYPDIFKDITTTGESWRQIQKMIAIKQEKERELQIERNKLALTTLDKSEQDNIKRRMGALRYTIYNLKDYIKNLEWSYKCWQDEINAWAVRTGYFPKQGGEV